MERYFLDQDDSCHWYIVPVARKAEWEAWLGTLPEEVPDLPDWVQRVDGSHRVTFTDPRID